MKNIKSKFWVTCILLFSISILNAQVTELWGMTFGGGPDGAGVIFKTDANGNNQSVEHFFNIDYPGSYPQGDLTEMPDGTLYGVTNQGAAINYIWGGISGLIFEYNPATNTYIKKFDLGNITDSRPQGELMLASNGKLYGVAQSGGDDYRGILFEYDPNTNIAVMKYNFKYDFEETDKGYYPTTRLIETSAGKLYGMTTDGGTNDEGTIFEYDINTSIYTKKYDFDGANGNSPSSDLTVGLDGKLYGLTYSGGLSDKGVLFEYDPITGVYAKKYDFDGANGVPSRDLLFASNNKFYGLTNEGNNTGALFEYDPTSGVLTTKYDFDGSAGKAPPLSLIEASNGKLYGLTQSGWSNNDYGTLYEFDLATDVYTKLHDFEWYTGREPIGRLKQASNGKLYGVTNEGGEGPSAGVLFEYDISTNTYESKLSFGLSSNGNSPYGNIIQATNGLLYGTVLNGGVNGVGFLFEFNPLTKTYTNKVEFDYTNGAWPRCNLMLASNGKIYGTTSYGGANNNNGVLFEYDPITNIYIKKIDFKYSITGSSPRGQLVEVSNGKLYGITGGGLFEYDPATNVLSQKLTFGGSSFFFQDSPSISLGANDVLYGTTPYGGVNDTGVLFEYNTTTSTFTKKFDFDNSNYSGYDNGAYPVSVVFVNGNLYGMTQSGGELAEHGVLFEFDLVNDAYSIKHSFSGLDGSRPNSELMLANNGNLYGNTWLGGTHDYGVLFEYNINSETFTKKLDFDGSNTGGESMRNSLFEVDLSLLGVDDFISEFSVSIFPNPAKDIITINSKQAIENITIYNIMGQNVNSYKKLINNQIDVSLYPKGFYILNAEINGAIQSLKFLKE